MTIVLRSDICLSSPKVIPSLALPMPFAEIRNSDATVDLAVTVA